MKKYNLGEAAQRLGVKKMELNNLRYQPIGKPRFRPEFHSEISGGETFYSDHDLLILGRYFKAYNELKAIKEEMAPKD